MYKTLFILSFLLLSIDGGSSEKSHLSNAKNAVFSRIISCIVNENMATGFIIPNSLLPFQLSIQYHASNQIWVFMSQNITERDYSSSPGYWIPLSGMPITHREAEHLFPKIQLLDPRDFEFPILINRDGKLHPLTELSELTNQLVLWNNITIQTMNQLTQEWQSSIEHQEYAYQTGKPIPRIEDADSLDWEQSLVEGNPTHPMHKTRLGVSPIGPISPNAKLQNPTVHFFGVPTSFVLMSGQYGRLIEPIMKKIAVELNEIIIPVHEIQLPIIFQNFKFARYLNHTESARALSSVRTLRLNNFPHLNFKFSLGIFISSVIRLIPPRETAVWNTLNPVIEKIVEDKELILVSHELGGATVQHPNDPNLSLQMTCLIRQDPEKLIEGRNEKIVLSAAITERINNTYAINTILNLTNMWERTHFFTNFIKLYTRAFITPIYKYAFAFAAHGQNVHLRFKFNESGGRWELIGFIITDLYGVELNRPILEEKTGLKLKSEFDGFSPRWDYEVEHVYNAAYFTHVFLHLHSMVRALDLHYCGTGWELIRNEFDTVFPVGSKIRKLWLESKTVHWSRSLYKKFNGLMLEYGGQIPNLLLFDAKLEPTCYF